MWEKPAFVTTVTAEKIWNVLVKADFRHVHFTINEYDLVGMWYQTVVKKLSEETVDFYSFAPWLYDFMVSEVKKLEAKRLYNLIPGISARPFYFMKRMSETPGRMSQEESKAVFLVCRYLASCAFVLMGSEGRTLVGLKDGIPVWKSAPRVTSDELPRYLDIAPLLSFGLIEEIGRSDEWLVPNYLEFDSNAPQPHYQDFGYTDVNAALVEAAFYNQRYTVDPEGVFVKLTNAQNVTGLSLKVKPSTTRDSLINVFARVETVDGAFLTAFSEERFLSSPKDATGLGSGSYITYLICQVYHDLVTRVDVPITRKRRPATAKLGSSETTSWTVIPRKARKGVREPREPLPNPTTMEPRRVTGHLRDRPMTEAHRQVLLEFEQKTGLQILRFVPEGQTFVRPHISPKTTEEELRGLPRFIRYRIQQSLEEAMQKVTFKE